jgi:6-phosphogluconolactonase
MATPGASGEAESRKKLLIFDAEEDLAASLAEHTAGLSEKFVAERGAFTVVLSGGSLIKALRYLDLSKNQERTFLASRVWGP